MLLVSNINIILSILVSLRIPKLNGIKITEWYNPISFICIFHIIIHTLIGTLLINNGFGDNSVLHKVSKENIYAWSNFIALSVYIYYLTNYLLLIIINKKIKFVDWLETKIVLAPTGFSNKNFYNNILLLLIICLIVAVYVTIMSGGIPHLRLFKMDLLEFRYGISRSFRGIIYLKTIFFDFLPILLSLIFYAYYLISKSKQTKWVFYLSFVLALYSTTFSFAKSPLIVYFLSLIITKKIILRTKLNYKLIFLFGLAIILFFYLISFDAPFWFIFQALINRIFIDEVSGSYLMYEIYPEIYPHIGIASLSSFIEFFGIDYQVPATRVAMLHAFGERASIYLNLLSTFYLGEAYANFGYSGLFFAPAYVSLIITTFYHRILKVQKTPLIIGVFAYTIVPSSMSSQFNNFLYNPIAIVLFIIISITLLISQKHQRN